eukprot:2836061-Rhodomonas_salina.2
MKDEERVERGWKEKESGTSEDGRRAERVQSADVAGGCAAGQEDIERLASAASAAGAGAREGGPEQLQVWQGRTKPSLGTLAET